MAIDGAGETCNFLLLLMDKYMSLHVCCEPKLQYPGYVRTQGLM